MPGPNIASDPAGIFGVFGIFDIFWIFVIFDIFWIFGIFDFLWMFHTMDYAGRDNFNNLLLRAFSLFGLATIVSGFTLFFMTTNKKRKQ